jgi:two-component system NarL family response regulator
MDPVRRRRRPITVLVVDPHLVVAEGLESLFASQPEFEVVGRASTVKEAITLAAGTAPDVVLADFRLPDGTGAEIAQSLRERRSRAAVVLLSEVESVGALLAAAEAGGRGYILKKRAASEVFDAVRRAAAGELLIPAPVLAELLSRKGDQAVLLSSLTEREREILGLMAKGLDNRQVAERLGITYGTVRSHVRSVVSKLGAHSKMEAVVHAEELGLIDPR